MNWDSPEERLALIESVGHKEYNRRLQEHQKNNVVSVVKGRVIRKVETRFGLLYMVGGTDRAFSTLKKAEDFAREAV